MATKQGLDKLPFSRIPDRWDPQWFVRFCREVLALADTRNAIQGEGVVITGTSDVPATISASADILNLILQPYILAQHTSLLPNERVLVGQAGFITATDGGPDGDFTIGIDQAMNPRWTGTHVWENPLYGPLGSAALPTFSADESRHAGLYFPDFNQVGISTDSTLRWDVNTARIYQTLPLQIRHASGAFIQNPTTPNDGVEITTGTSSPVGSNSTIAMWEQGQNYGFRWFMEGTDPTDAFLRLFVHDNSASGTEIWRVTRTTKIGRWLTQVQLADGLVGTPGIAFASQTDTGFYQTGTAGQIGVAAGGTLVVRIAPTFVNFGIPIRGTSGSASTPGYSFNNNNDFDTGMFRIAEDELGLATGGVQRLSVSTTAFIGTIPWRGPNGSASAPSLSFSGGTGNGLFLATTNTPALAVAGSEMLRFNSSFAMGIAGANYGTSGHVLKTAGSGGAVSWGQVGPTGIDLTANYTWTGQHTFSGRAWFTGDNSTDYGTSASHVSIGAGGGAARVIFVASAGGSNQKLWDFIEDADGSSLYIRALNDALTDGRTAVRYFRSGLVLTDVHYGNPTDNPAHTVFGSIIFASLSATAVSLGDPDSGGTGYRVLRVPN